MHWAYPASRKTKGMQADREADSNVGLIYRKINVVPYDWVPAKPRCDHRYLGWPNTKFSLDVQGVLKKLKAVIPGQSGSPKRLPLQQVQNLVRTTVNSEIKW